MLIPTAFHTRESINRQGKSDRRCQRGAKFLQLVPFLAGHIRRRAHSFARGVVLEPLGAWSAPTRHDRCVP